MPKIISCLLIVLVPMASYSQVVTISGYINAEGSKEYLSGVHIRLEQKKGTYSNAYGFYAIQVNAGSEITISFSHVGYITQSHTFLPKNNISLNVNLVAETAQLDNVVISGATDNQPVLGVIKFSLPINQVKNTPELLGEKDIIKTLQLLPGVQRGVEGSTSLFVRGGSADQNLILLDDASVYNANHLFGFFSVFNADALKHVDFWKAGFPARYGGRISSVIDIKMKEGDKEKIKGEGGVGLLSSRLTLEGPLQKEKTSFIISTRRSYIDLITKPFMSAESIESYRFYDINAKLNTVLNSKNKIFLGVYFGNDKLRTEETVKRTQSTIKTKTTLGWGNATMSMRWNYLIGNKLFVNTTLLYSRFNFYLKDHYTRTGLNSSLNNIDNSSSVIDYSIKTDFDFFPVNEHAIKFGAIVTHHTFSPRDFTIQDTASGYDSSSSQIYRNKEVAIYIEDTWTPSNKISTNFGIRSAAYFTNHENYLVLEPRVSLSYTILQQIIICGSYARTNQFVHLLSNTGIGLSTDLWVPVTNLAPPQQADQFAIGFNYGFKNRNLTLSLESYRKYLRNVISYKSNASFLVIDGDNNWINWEDNIATGRGWSYGTDVLLQRKKGIITGWLSYTLSWTIHQFDEINNGKRFFPRQDSRHNISLVNIIHVSPTVKISSTWVYGTGNAMTVPLGYYYGNTANGTGIRTTMVNNIFTNQLVNTQINRIPYFGGQNSFRAEAYHRLDLALQLHKNKKHYKRYWEFGLFNAYNRKNPFYYYLQATNDYVNNGQRIELKKKSLFPILPSISYNFSF